MSREQKASSQLSFCAATAHGRLKVKRIKKDSGSKQTIRYAPLKLTWRASYASQIQTTQRQRHSCMSFFVVFRLISSYFIIFSHPISIQFLDGRFLPQGPKLECTQVRLLLECELRHSASVCLAALHDLSMIYVSCVS